MPFQTTVNAQPAPAVEGDFAGANPRRSMLAGASALVAAAPTVNANGVTIGKFARARNSDGAVTNAAWGTAYRLGFVHRDQPSIIVPFLGAATMLVPPGLDMTLHDGGDFWARFTAGAAIGQQVFATYADGSAVAGTAGSPPAGLSFTGSVTTNVLTVTVADVTPDPILPGQPINGGTLTAGTKVIAQLTGTPGGIGTYSTTATADTTSGVLTGPLAEQTNWIVQSTAANGELAMISTLN